MAGTRAQTRVKGASRTSDPGASPEQCRSYLRQMRLIRHFEEKAGEAYSLGKIGGFCHLYIGQEAVAVGSIALRTAWRLRTWMSRSPLARAVTR